MEQMRLAAIARNYRPANIALDRLGRVKLLMLIGPTGVGKSALAKASGMAVVIGDASRAPRANEQDGIDYWFHSEDEMVRRIEHGNYLQVAVGSEGDIKATHIDSFPESGQAIFAVAASAIPAFRSLPFAQTATAVIVPPDFDSWMERLRAHGTAAEKLAPRLAEARQSYHFALQDEAAVFVLNDDIGRAVERLRQAAAGQQPDDAGEARSIAEGLLRAIG